MREQKLKNLTINYLTQAQYDAIDSPNENELYLTEMVESSGGSNNTTLNSESIIEALNYTPENISNKVTSISSSSTDEQYPTAKCVYNMLGDIETLLSQV